MGMTKAVWINASVHDIARQRAHDQRIPIGEYVERAIAAHESGAAVESDGAQSKPAPEIVIKKPLGRPAKHRRMPYILSMAYGKIEDYTKPPVDPLGTIELKVAQQGVFMGLLLQNGKYNKATHFLIDLACGEGDAPENMIPRSQYALKLAALDGKPAVIEIDSEMQPLNETARLILVAYPESRNLFFPELLTALWAFGFEVIIS